jgi:hypothetical protein
MALYPETVKSERIIMVALFGFLAADGSDRSGTLRPNRLTWQQNSEAAAGARKLAPHRRAVMSGRDD